ncbi:MAG: insulinase family protein [Clostridia bacterium]|nr:insulinase family protein [Clostridia bacterium]
MEYYNQLLDESYHKKTLDNGFKIYILPKRGYTKKHAFFCTEYGSLYNQFEKDGKTYDMPKGIAHFLEHKIFDEDQTSIFETFAELGASVNAFTNYFATCYTLSTVDHFEESLVQLLSFVQRLNIDDDAVEKEKKVIIQELKMYDDQPQWLAYTEMLKGLYHDHPIQYDIGGSIESVEAITKEDLEICYNSFYVPNRMMLFVIGDVDIEETFALAEAHLTEEFMKRPMAPKIILPDEPDDISKKFCVNEMGLPCPILYMGIKDRTFYDDTKARLKKGIISKLLTDLVFGKGSDFYETHYDTGLINASFSSDFSYGRTFGYTGISAETKEPELLVKAIEDEIERVKKEGLDQDGFERIRKKMIGRHLSSFNSTQYIANTFVNYYMKGIELFDYLETLEKITFKEIEDRFLSHFDLKYSTVSLVK